MCVAFVMDNIIHCVLILLNVVFFFNFIQTCEFTQLMESDQHIHLSENETLNLSFYLNNANCNMLQDIRFKIGKDRNDIIVCTILFEKDTACTQTDNSNSCSCEGKSGTYRISIKMKRNDSGLWKFMTTIKGKVKVFYEINVTVNYQANVLRLEVDGQDVHSSYTLTRGRNASIVCIWENGNIPVTARLLGNSGKILTEANENLIYPYVASNCNEDTFMTCEADESRKNISLLTICPPEFVSTSPKPVISANTFTCQVRAHTTNITECRLYKLTQPISTSEFEVECHPESKTTVENVSCSITSTSVTFSTESYLNINQRGKHCSCSMEGTVPYLNFILQFNNFTEHDDGEWILALSNKGGCNTTTFVLQFSVINTLNGNEESHYLVILAVTMASTILVALFIITFAVKKKGNMVSGFWKRQKQNNIVEYRSPTEHQIHGGISMVVNGMYDVSEECVSPAAFSPNDGVHRSEGTVVGITDIYARVMKKSQGRAVNSDLNTEQEDIQSFNNPSYEVVSPKKDMETHKTVTNTREKVIEYANPFYGIKNCALDDQNIKSDPRNNGSSLDGNGETSFTISTDIYNLSHNIDECSQPPAEARQNAYMGVSIERQDTRIFQRSAQPLIKVQE